MPGSKELEQYQPPGEFSSFSAAVSDFFLFLLALAFAADLVRLSKVLGCMYK
jgi:hypothetical protein